MVGTKRIAALVAFALWHCSTPQPGIDAAPADTIDAPSPIDATDALPPGPCTGAPITEVVQLVPARAVMPPLGRLDVEVRLSHDACDRHAIAVTADPPGIVSVSPAFTTPGEGTASFSVTAANVGATTVTVSAGALSATLTVRVAAPRSLDCIGTAPQAGSVGPGGSLVAPSGSALAGASIAIPSGASTVSAATMSLACASTQAPAGYTAIGPAVAFGPSAVRFPRDVAFALPVDLTQLPARDALRVEIAYAGPSVPRAAIVPVASGHLAQASGADVFAFEAPRAGTYLPVVRSGIGTRSVTRHLTHRAIMGISMGAAGASLIGTHHPELFDAIVPLGGPVEWGYTLSVLRQRALAGFCTAAQRAAGMLVCDHATIARTPPLTEPFEQFEDYEHLYEEGPGGSMFDRARYMTIFRDLARMFGNPLLAAGTTGFLPAGVPDSEAQRPDAERCAHPISLSHYYDARYNPTGALPVITFCDGNNAADAPGVWDPMVPAMTPAEMSLAVDVNGNGQRDGGEPILVQSTEPFRDDGRDGVPDSREPGFDPVSNPDPNADDYDWQYNPGGTEGNTRYDGPMGTLPGESFDDVGLDGVMGTPQISAGGYDLGEANGRFDSAPGIDEFFRQNPLAHVNALDDATLARLAVWQDGGVRDLVDFGADEDRLAGGFGPRPGGMHLANGFATLAAASVSETDYGYTLPDWAHLPRHVMVRYGSLDATPDQIARGDGTHVGTAPQSIQRIESALRFITAQWPNADHGLAVAHLNAIPGDDCTRGYICTLQIVSANAHRTSPTIVLLPPGYHDASHANDTYPVIVLLHGYGDGPEQLQQLYFDLAPEMASPNGPSWQRLPKAIIVLADGRCRTGDVCLLGSFFANGVHGSAQIETAIVDALGYIDAHFRTRPASDVTVME